MMYGPEFGKAIEGFIYAAFSFAIASIVFFVLAVVFFLLWINKETKPQLIEPLPYVELPALTEQEFEEAKAKLK